MQTFLQLESDMQWLRETHLPQRSAKGFSCAVLFGNEDSPERIVLCGYRVDSWAREYRPHGRRYRMAREGRFNQLTEESGQ